MAGLGRKVFASGDILLASEVQGFLQDQSVMVFDDNAARTAAIATPTEGMVTFRKDDNALEVFDGSTFVAVGGGAEPGLIHIEQTALATVATQDFTAFFDSTKFRGYKIVINNFGSNGGAELRFRFRNASGAISSGYFGAASVVTNTGSASGGFSANNAAQVSLNNYTTVSNQNGFTVFDLLHSANLKSYSIHGQSIQYFTTSAVVFSFGHRATDTVLTGFSLIASAGTITGDCTIFGYAKA